MLKLIEQTSHRLPKLILEHRHLKRFVSTYGTGNLLQCIVGGRVHTTFLQTGTATGRLSSEQPNLQNLQNRFVFERRTGGKVSRIVGKAATPIVVEEVEVSPRAAIKPTSLLTPAIADSVGYKIVSADFCEIELRMLVHFCQEPELLDILRQNAGGTGSAAASAGAAAAAASGNAGSKVDVFMSIASAWGIGGISRATCKRTVYAAIYGVGPETLASQLGHTVTAARASALLSSFASRFPTIGRFKKQVIAGCRKTGFSSTLLGRRRMFKDAITSRSWAAKSAAERQCFNHVLQGSAADATKIAMVHVQQQLDASNVDARLLLQIHDELVLECAAKDVGKVTAMLTATMESAIKLSLPLPVTVKSGCSWE